MNETLADALAECIKAAGGMKVVGVALWPAKGVDGAHRALLNALNTDRPEKLALDQIVMVMRLGRDAGCHAAMDFLAAALSYQVPHPVEPAQEIAALQREFVESTKKLQAMLEQIARAGQTVRRAA
ncbi:MAG: hypothetical protein ACRCV9_17660 [Burkholderiaceae bacterium]